MSLSSYSELLDTIESWLNAPAVAQDIPTFVTLAEAQANRDIRHSRMEQRSTATLDSQYSSLPTDWLETLSLSLDNQRLEYVSRDNILEMAEKTNAHTGVTKYYTLVGGELEFYPRPATDSTMTLIYRQKIPTLSADQPTNWLLQTFPEVYLYGSLLHSAPYLQEDARVAMWVQLYSQVVQQVNADGARAKAGGSNMRLKIKGLS